MVNLYRTLLLVSSLSIASQAWAGDNPLVEKTKTYNKSYTVSNDDRITLDNRFGELKINTWNKNEVKVDITIRAEARTDEVAQRILDKISIQDGKSGNGVYFKTIVGNDNNQRWEKGEKQGFSIDYVVSVPARNPLNASNEFGNMVIGDYSGELTLQSKFGSLNAGKLTNVKKVNVEFGSANIAAVNNGSISIKFSKAEVKNLDGSIKADFEHCGGVKLGVTNNVKDLNIKNSFTQLYLDCSTDLSANFDIRTSFAELKNKSNFSIKKEDEDDDRRGPRFDHRYSGKSGNGSTDMQIRSNFGNIILGHNLPFDTDDDKKDKNKNRNRTRDI